MSDILREAWAYQKIMQEGEIRARHQVVLDVIQARFPELLPYAKKQLEAIQDTEVKVLGSENEHSADGRGSSPVYFRNWR